MALTNRERREQRRQQRLDAQRKVERTERVRLFGVVGGIVVIGIIVAVVFLLNNRGAASGPVLGVHMDDPRTAANQLYDHVPEGSPINYSHYPPSFGPHYPTPKQWGVYDSPIPEGYFVHNLEHGGIVVLYHCPSGCSDVVNQLKNLPATLPKERFGEVKVVIAPYDKSDHLITLLAWDYELDMDQLDLNTIQTFYKQHVDKSPEQVA